jgi:hypothetical protein
MTRLPERAPDPIAERLAEIREDRGLASELPMTADPRRVIDRQVPRLLDAIEAVLALAGEWAALAPPDDWGETPHDTVQADDGRAIRVAIAAALLLGED